MRNENPSVETIFHQVLEQDPSDRTAFLDQLCGEDSELRCEVEELLRFHETPGMYMEKPVLQWLDIAEDSAKCEVPTDQIDSNDTKHSTGNRENRDVKDGWPTFPGHEVLEELGRGGMGVVYLARQIRADRLVALKVILAQNHANREDRQRFQIEAEAIARLQHPGIVQIFEVSEHENNPYFTLEYCRGGNLSQYLNGIPVTPQEAAELTASLANAIQTAHDAQIIHRDLKPANVLLTPTVNSIDTEASGQSRSSLSNFSVKITDFSLAKNLDSVTLTAPGRVAGTPAYMAPEQAQSGQNMTVAVDVYALGTILYECLTGRPPFQAATAPQTILQVIQQEPVAPRQLSSAIPRDAETICLKCLHKDPRKRYASARELADDLQRYLDGKPIQARPVGLRERGWRWCRRNPLIATLLMLLFLTLTGGIIGTSIALHKADSNRKVAEKNLGDAEHQKRLAEEKSKQLEEKSKQLEEKTKQLRKELSRKEAALFSGQLARADGLVNLRPREALGLLLDLDLCPIHMRRFAWNLVARQAEPGLTIDNGKKGVYSVAFSPDGKTLATGGADGHVRLYEVATGRLRATLPKQSWPIY